MTTGYGGKWHRRLVRDGVPADRKKSESKLKDAAARAVGVAAIVLFLPVIGVVLIALPAILVWKWYRKHQFVRAHEGTAFVIVTRRHGWKELIENNVVPALPAGVVAVWDGDRMDGFRPTDLPEIRPTRPYLISLRGRRVSVRPLHEDLRPFKQRGKRNEATQAEIRRLIEVAVQSPSLYPLRRGI